MAGSFLRRCIRVPLVLNSPIHSWVCNLCSEASRILDNEKESKPLTINSANYSSRTHISPLLPPGKAHLEDFRIEVVDPDTWRVSSGLAQVWKGTDKTLETRSSIAETVDEAESYSPLDDDEPDFDEIEDMRIRGNLFYKLDKDSREFEEYNFSFRRKKSSKKCKEDPKESKKENTKTNSSSGGEKLTKIAKNRPSIPPPPEEMYGSYVDKKLRTPTFNQLTGPYHEPFCLDIYISKSSVRVCIIHRVTSKVVAVAHSISKDMKFDLVSTKDSTACAAVGGILAQRALADDIHDVVYTPRKGEKLEGKLQTVLQSVINGGINVKVKIKQRRAKKVVLPSK